MASQIPGTALRSSIAGTKVSRAAAVLPATATTSYFRVSGGAVIITALVGRVTTATSATATTVSVGFTPTVGTAAAAGVASATAVTSKEVGTMMTVQASAGAAGALVVGGNAGAAVYLPAPLGFMVTAGDITITTSATNTGATSWDLTYIPLDDGASVIAV